MEDIRSFDSSLFFELIEPPMAHVSISIGHKIFFIGGYRICYDDDVRTITTFDRNHFLYYNIVNHKLNVIECLYNTESIGCFPKEFFCASGMAATCVGRRIYLFGGYSLTKQESGNALYFIEINKNIIDSNNLDVRKQSDGKPEATLEFICGTFDDMPEEAHISYPSYRDKCSLVHWNNKLYVFGGYGSNFRRTTSEMGSYTLIGHDFLGDNGVYVSGTGNRGWTNQVLVFCLKTNKWSNPETGGNVPCPRAAHCAEVVDHRMFIFGGRLGLMNTVRTNNCFYLNLISLQWTKVDLQGSEIVGRSWSTITALTNNEFFIVGGFSGQNIALNDAYLINVDFSTNIAQVTKKNKVMHQAMWDPFMDSRSWNNRETFEPIKRMWHSTSLTPDGHIYIFGGCQNNLILQVEQIQSIVESTIPIPPSLYNICLWNTFKDLFKQSNCTTTTSTTTTSNRKRKSSIDINSDYSITEIIISRTNVPNRIFNDLVQLCL